MNLGHNPMVASMGQAQKITRIGIVASMVRVTLVLSLAAGMSCEWFYGLEVGLLSLGFASVGVVSGLSVGLWVIRRLESQGYRFPKIVEDGVPWTVDVPCEPKEKTISN